MKTKIFTTAIACLLFFTAQTQFSTRYQGTLGGNDGDGCTSTWLTADGGIILGGWSNSNVSGSKTENSRGYADYWIIKLKRNGKKQWDKTFGGSSGDYLQFLQQTSDGGYILGGGSSSNISGEKTENSRGIADYWIVKLDANGTKQWDKTFGGSDDEWLYSLQQSRDGGYILGGSSWSNISGEKSENSRGQSDYWIVKLDANGTKQWDKTFGGSDYDEFKSLQQTKDGGYILGGYSLSNISGEKSENSRGQSDYWIVKLDSNGTKQWDKTFGGSNDEWLGSVQQTSDGGYLLGGASSSNISGEKTENSRGYNDYWIVKLRGNGKKQWDKAFGGSNDDYLNSLHQTSDGGYILGGYSESNISGEKSEDSRGYSDYWVVKLGSNGLKQWDKTIGGSSSDFCNAIKEAAENTYIVAGQSYSDRSYEKKETTIGLSGLSDYWVVLLNYISTPVNKAAPAFEITALIQQQNKTALSVYPNPVKEKLFIKQSGKTTIALINAVGKICLTQTISGNATINISKLTPGNYFVKNITTQEVVQVMITR